MATSTSQYYSKQFASGAPVLMLPAANGRLNGVNLTDLNRRARMPRARAAQHVTSWTLPTISTPRSFNTCRSVCWAPELSLLVAGDDSNVSVLTSSDFGLTWTSREAGVMLGIAGICWAPELSMLVVLKTFDPPVTSSDCVTWVTRTIPQTNWAGVCWAPELCMFAACGGGDAKVMTSSNGIAWTLATNPVGSSSGMSCICWSPGLGLFCAAGTDQGMTSPNGTTWTLFALPAEAGQCTAMCWSAELAMFCAVTDTGKVLTSSTGSSFSSFDTPATQLAGVVWAKELSMFCAVPSSSNSASMLTSHDGTTWATRATPIFTAASICWIPEARKFLCPSTNGTSALASVPPAPLWDISAAGTSVRTNARVCIGTNATASALNVAGSIEATGNITGFVSDARLKTDVCPMLDFDALLDGLRPCRFTWNELGQRVSGKGADVQELGFLAQEVEAVLPEVVAKHEVATQLLGLRQPVRSIAYDRMVTVVIACLQSQRARIAALERAVARLRLAEDCVEPL
ncbi:hypothetical protein COO60DRAFT_1644280 [Scenedesmus sp. NREL 46B-D3]|nr:hypothetical protein COO60DRAFT_1644280 [Scenedesmus sp. NREL 46B-D3]